MVADANTCGEPFTGSLSDYDAACSDETAPAADQGSILILTLVFLFLALFAFSFVFELNMLAFVAGMGFAFIGFIYMTTAPLKILFVALGAVMVLVWGLRSANE